MEDRYQVYVSLVELLLKLGKPDVAFFYSEKLRARSYFDQLGNAAPIGGDSAAQQRIQELGEQIRALRHAIQKEYAVPEKERRGHALELYSAELGRAERDYEKLLDDIETRGPIPEHKWSPRPLRFSALCLRYRADRVCRWEANPQYPTDYTTLGDWTASFHRVGKLVVPYRIAS